MKPLDVEALQMTVKSIATLRDARENWLRFREEATERIRRLDKEIEDARCKIDSAIADATVPPIRPPRSLDSAVIAPDVLPDVAPAA